MKARVNWPSLALLVATVPLLASAQSAPKLSKEESDFFEAKVRPVLVANCYKCHSVEEKKNKGGLVLDSREGWQKGGEHGPAIVPGKPDQSLLIKAVRLRTRT